MSTKGKIVEIKEQKPATNANANVGCEVQLKDVDVNGGEGTEEVKFLQHPFKWIGQKFEKHPVASTTVTVGVLGVLGFIGKCIVDALGGDTESDDNNEDPDDYEDEDEDNDEI